MYSLFKSSEASWISLTWASFLTLAITSTAETGSIKGAVDAPERVVGVMAVDRSGGKTVHGVINREIGDFLIEGLVPDRRYDCVIDFQGGRLEGIDLSVPPSDYVEEQPLSEEDRSILLKKINVMNRFEDQVQVMALVGNIQHAVVLLNKLRTKPFYGATSGEVIWRVERWRFERPEETWAKVQDELFAVLYRERLQAAAFAKKHVVFDSTLGGLAPVEKDLRVELGRVTLPAVGQGVQIRNVFAPVTTEDE